MAMSSPLLRRPENRATTILLIGSTGHGKSTLGNFLLHPDEEYQAQRELQPFRTATSNRPETRHVVVKSNSKSNPTLHVIDTPGLNESSEKDLEHMIEVVRSLRKVQCITACILCIKFDARIDAQYKSTIAYYKKLLPRLFEGNVLIALTNYATDKRSVRMREMQGIDVVGVIRNTVEEVVRRGFLSFEPQVFLIDSLPLDPIDLEQSEKTREAILDYVKTMHPIAVNDLRVPKTDALRQHDEKRMVTLIGEIHGYNMRLKQVNTKAEEVLEKIEELGREMFHISWELKQSKEQKSEYDTLDLATVAEWSLRKKWKMFRWQSESFSCSCKPCPLVAHTTWDNGHLVWSNIVVTRYSVEGTVEGKFSRGLYANVTLKTYRKEKYRKLIQEHHENIENLERESVRLKKLLISYYSTHQEYLADVKLLQNYIDRKSKEMLELSPEYMSLEEAEKALLELLHYQK